jgi:hypothetical protein
VEVFGTVPACPDFCVADYVAADYPAPLAVTHQLVTHTDGLVQDVSCDPATTACDGEDETLMADLPSKSSVRLGGARYQALFVAPVAGEYTFRSRFDDVGEVWLSKDADPRHTDLIIESTAAAADGWFGPRHNPHHAHIKMEVKTRFDGPLYLTLLGASGRTEEMLLVRGSAGWQLPSAGDCESGKVYAEYFSDSLMNDAPAAARCEDAPERTGYIIDKWEDTDLSEAAVEMDVPENDFAIRYTTSVLFPEDGVYRIRARANQHSFTTISNQQVFVVSGWRHHGRDDYVDMAFKAGVHSVIYDYRGTASSAQGELKWELLTSGTVEGAIAATKPIVQEHIRDIVPINQHGFPCDLGAVRAIRLRNPDDLTCLETIDVTVRGRTYTFVAEQCFRGEAELDVVSAKPMFDLAEQVSATGSSQVVGDSRVARDGLVTWLKWSGWDKTKQVWSDASGNGNDATPYYGAPLETIIEGPGLHGAAGEVGYIAGDLDRGIDLGGVIQTQFTICSVTRYTSTVAETQARILDGKTINWLHGHHGGHAGVAFYENWAVASIDNKLTLDGQETTDWVVLCGSNDADAPVLLDLTAGPTDISPASSAYMGGTGIGINRPGASEPSDWALAELMTWDRHLSESEMTDAIEYLAERLENGNLAPEAASSAAVVEDDQQASEPVTMAAGEVRFLEVVHANSAGPDESLVTLAIETTATRPRSCAQILADSPESETGVYTVDPAGTGEPFEVMCDMDTEGGGWFMLTLANPNSDELPAADWHGVMMMEQSSDNCWAKCDDDAAQFYQGAVETTPWVDDGTVGVLPLKGMNSQFSDTTWDVKYARPDTGAIYSREQMDALRTQVAQLSSGSRIVATTADDDGSADDELTGGHEVYAYDADGVEMLLTPGEDGNCGSSSPDGQVENSRTGVRLWATAAHQSVIGGDVSGLSGPLPDLPGNFALPAHVRLAVRTGGGCSFGFEQRTILARPGKEWVPAVTAAYCSHPDVTAAATCSVLQTAVAGAAGSTCYQADLGSADPAAACAAQDTDCVFVADNPATDANEARCNPPACEGAVLDGDDAANQAACTAVSADCQYLSAQSACEAQNTWTDAKESGSCSNAELTTLGASVCRATNSWDADASACSNDYDSAASCVSPNTWVPPVWRSFCEVADDGQREATLTCSSPEDSRISSCANGFYRVPGTDDDPLTADTDETTADACEPNRCTAMSETDLATAGYTAASPDGVTVPGLGALACASGFRLTLIASAATAACPSDGGSFRSSRHDGRSPEQCESAGLTKPAFHDFYGGKRWSL